MAPIPGLRNLVLAAAAAVITSAGAVYVLMQPADTTRKITGTVAAAPGLAWSVDAAATYDGASPEFRDPVPGTEYDIGGASFVDAGDTLVAVVGSSDGDMSLRNPTMVGIDAATGAVRWRTPAAHLGGCARAPLDNHLVCFTGPSEPPALVGYDIGSGEVTRTSLEWSVFALATDENRLYLAEGDVESDDVRVHSGTLADPDAHWTRAFTMGTAWESLPTDALDVSQGQGLFELGTTLAGFDLGTGTPTWTAELAGCSRTTRTNPALVVRIHTDCSGYRITGSDILDHTGRVLATTNHEAAHSLSIDLPTDDTVPVLLGDGAYDRRTGKLLWTSPDLVTQPRATQSEYGNATSGSAIALLGDVALLRDDAAGTTTGLDMRTGRRLWQHATERSGTPNAWDGEVVVFADSTGLWAIDPKSGSTVWDIPFRAVTDVPDALSDGGRLTVRGKGHYGYASARTLISLRPLGR
ncbi:outer membrane protein assembly factor BamB family protein [Nocardia suismassiliense]|uniref:outer membrane protein assembly factor BamB family protein n=1 Tax=Nocardia suismassiliense TaxID=2077092 RepID=UPI000D1D7A42|nr:PQQ-binding-like beta-propeller repeat protein [Nocardia suismassiliense]